MRNVFLAIMASALTAGAQEVVVNGDFSAGLDGWSGPSWTKNTLETQDVVSAGNAVRLNPNGAGDAQLWQDIKLKPETEYVISFHVKGEKLSTGDSARNGTRIGVCSVDFKKSLEWGPDGLWKFLRGECDWRKAEFRFNSKYFEGRPTRVVLSLGGCRGSALFDDVSIREVASKGAISMDVYPLKLMKEPFGVCENLPGTLVLETGRKGGASGEIGVMTIELPEFLRLADFSSRHPVVRDGVCEPLRPKIREGSPAPGTRKYEVDLDADFVRRMPHEWHYYHIMLSAEPGSAGKSGEMRWQAKVGGETLPPQSARVTALPPVRLPGKPAQKFGVRVAFPATAALSGDFWSGLSVKRSRLLQRFDKPSPGFEEICWLSGNDLLSPLPKSRQRLVELRKKHGTPLPIALMVDDPQKEFEAHFRDSLRELRETWPGVRTVEWDFEPGANHFDAYSRERFAKVLKIDVPSVEAVKESHWRRWLDYTIELHNRHMEKAARIFREELPDAEFHICTDQLHAGPQRIDEWCAVDAEAAEKYFDGSVHMPYYAGVRFFDDVALNMKVMSKPVFQLVDPAERQASFFNQYTPPRVRQNIVAAAALGSEGIGFWPNEAFTGEYFREIAEAFDLVARHEDYYFGGTRVDDKVTVTPLNTASRELTGSDGKKFRLDYPDLGRTMRYVAHELKGRRLVTLFNYNEKERLIAEIAGPGFKYVVRVEPGSLLLSRPESAPPQKELLAEAAAARGRGADGIFSDVRDGDSSLYWEMFDGRPVLASSVPGLKTRFDALGAGEAVGIEDARGNELGRGGYIGKLTFFDKEQRVPEFVPDVSRPDSIRSHWTVPPFDGANPKPNPLMGLRVEREFRPARNSVEVAFRFSNPESSPMRFGVRAGNFIRPGLRFGQAGSAISLGTPADGDNIYLASGRRPDFMSHLKPGAWDGGPVVISAREGRLADEAVLSTGPGVSGFYVWRHCNDITLEPLSGEILLNPGETTELKYRIEIK